MPLSGKKILVVDDEEGIREIYREELEYHGAVVVEAAGGNQAYEVFMSDLYDAVVSDVRMPKGDGVELLERIKNSDRSAPVILISGLSDLTREDTLEKGAVELLYKPCSADDLIQCLERVT